MTFEGGEREQLAAAIRTIEETMLRVKTQNIFVSMQMDRLRWLRNQLLELEAMEAEPNLLAE